MTRIILLELCGTTILKFCSDGEQRHGTNSIGNDVVKGMLFVIFLVGDRTRLVNDKNDPVEEKCGDARY